MTDDEARAAALALLREADRDRYLTVLLAPAAARTALLALYAFNVEIARIPWQVREPMAGEIRLQWWRDVLEGVAAGDAAAHPVAYLLTRAFTPAQRAAPAWGAIIDAHGHDLYRDPFPTLADLERYAAETSGQVFALSLDCVGAGEAEGVLAPAAGIAHALVGLLVALPRFAAAERLYLPADLLEQHGLTAATIGAPDKASARAALTHALLDRADLHLATALAASRMLRRPARAVLAPLAITRAERDRLRKQGDPFALRPLSPLRRQWLLWRATRA